MDYEKIKLVIADDNKEFASILKEYMLAQKDIDLIGIANDGYEALKYVNKYKVDVLVLDIIMPSLNGFDVLEKVKIMNYDKKPKVIVLSGASQEKFIKRAINLGAEYYIIKPFDINVFTNRIRQLFSSK